MQTVIDFIMKFCTSTWLILQVCLNKLSFVTHLLNHTAGCTGVPSSEELQLVNRYLNEPMVIRESTDHSLPTNLVLAYSLVQPQTANAAVLTVLDVLMSELGYQRNMVGLSFPY